MRAAAAALCAFVLATAARAAAPLPLPTPSAEQLHLLDNALSMFIHFSVCTFNDGCDGGQQNCQGSGAASRPYPAASFNPSNVDTDQWARTAVAMGAKQACLTTHHSGGFALWPTRASNYSILASPFGATGRDIVREFVNSMRAHDVEPCFYIVLNMDVRRALRCTRPLRPQLRP
jgi:alpha-L-fucosidase